MPLDFDFELTPSEALEKIERQTERPLSWRWSEVWQEQNIKAFTIAKMTSATLLDEVHQSLAEAMRTGQPFEEWRREAIRKLEGRWLGRTQGELWDELPPAEKAKRQPPTDSERNQVIKESRLTTIFTTNMLSAYQAGRYQQLQESVEEYPYWRYKSMGDSHVRPAHRALNGKVFRADDPFWASHYPPNGFNCRCSVEPLDDYDLKLDGLKVERGKMKTERDEEGRERSVYIDADGKSYPTDPGWSYNPGEINGPLKVFSEQKFTPSIQRQVDKDLESIRQLDSDYRSQVERRREAESQERRQLAERLEEARRQAELQAKARAEAAEEEAAKRREQEEREAQRLVAESERQVAQEQKRQAQEEREIEAQAKRQSAQILRREKQEAKRQQEALANLERAAQKERRQEAKARAQEEALAQRLVERSQKEREEEARRLEEVERKPERSLPPYIIGDGPPTSDQPETTVLNVRGNPEYNIATIRQKIRNLPVEHGVLYNRVGLPLIGVRGDKHQVNLTPGLWEYALELQSLPHYKDKTPEAIMKDIARDALLVHNHPENNSTLSGPDIKLMCSLQLREVQAVTPWGTYTMSLTSKQREDQKLLGNLQAVYSVAAGIPEDPKLGSIELEKKDREIYNLYLIHRALVWYCKRNSIKYTATEEKSVIKYLNQKYKLKGEFKLKGRTITNKAIVEANNRLKRIFRKDTIVVEDRRKKKRKEGGAAFMAMTLENSGIPVDLYLIDDGTEWEIMREMIKMRDQGSSLEDMLRRRMELMREKNPSLYEWTISLYRDEPDETNPQLHSDTQPSQ